MLGLALIDHVPSDVSGEAWQHCGTWGVLHDQFHSALLVIKSDCLGRGEVAADWEEFLCDHLLFGVT